MMSLRGRKTTSF